MTFWSAPLNALFDSLCEGGPPREAEVIFVFAGHPERKRYGIELWRRGCAPTLVLSVARFEWRRFAELGLPDGGLIDLVQETRPEERLFFVVLDRAGARAFRVHKSGLGTWSEARALAEYIERERIGSVLVVSSAIHLRRAVTTLRGLLRGSQAGGVRIDATAVPEHAMARDGWWRTPRTRRAVLWEAVKLFLYRVRLGLMTLSGR
jgi:uncharacterized SAM-binding protein YcdF (DUF218 family)